MSHNRRMTRGDQILFERGCDIRSHKETGKCSVCKPPKRCHTPWKRQYTTRERARRALRGSQEAAVKHSFDSSAKSVYECKCGFWHLTKREPK